jgi:hypothetical protein
MIASHIIIYLNNYFIRFYFFTKIECYEPTPLKMNLILEIQMDRKRNLETLPSTLLLSPM